MHYELVGSKALDPCSSKAVPSKVQKDILAVKLFVLAVDQHNNKYTQVPQTLIQESGTYLHEIGSLYHVVLHQLSDLVISNGFHRKSHGQQAVGIFTESLSVGEISPSAKDLSKDKSVHDGVTEQKEVLLFDLSVYK